MKRGYFKDVRDGMIVSGTISVMIYFARGLISPIVNSYDICNNERLVESSWWYIPKIAIHCPEILTLDVEEYPGAEVAIIVDIWVAIFTMCFFLYVSKELWNGAPVNLNELREKVKNNRTKWGMYFIFSILMFPVLVSCIFVWLPLVPDGSRGDIFFLLSPVPGLGFLFLSMYPFVFAFLLGFMVAYIRVLFTKPPQPNTSEILTGILEDSPEETSRRTTEGEK